MKRIVSYPAGVSRKACALPLLLGALLALAPQLAPGAGPTYGWGGSFSADWNDAGNWQAGIIAPTGDTYDVTIIVTNTANNILYYTAAQGTTVFTNSGQGSGRCLRIGDLGKSGTLDITGGSLQTFGSGDLIGNGAGTGTLMVDGGTYISTNATVIMGAFGSTGIFTVNSGTAMVATVQCGTGAGGETCNVNLNGGLLRIKALTMTFAGTLNVNLAGGTLQAATNTANWLVVTSATYNVSGPVNFDTQSFTVTNAAPLTGAGSVTKIGAGLLVLSGSNSGLSGDIILNEGTLGINNALALGTGALTINGGNLDSTSGMTNGYDNALNWNSDFTFTGSKSLGLGAGLVTLDTNHTVTVTANTLTIGGLIWGFVDSTALNTFDITKAGSGTLTLTADIANLRDGQTNTVSAGTENIVGNISGAGLNVFDLVKAGAGTVNYSAPITLLGDQTNSMTAGTAIFSGVIDDGGNNYGLALKGGGNVTLSANNTFGGGLTLLASNQVTLSGSNSYDGLTLITGGSKLIIGNNNALGSTAGATVVTNTGVLSLLNGITVTGEPLFISGNGSDNFGALQAATASTSTWAGPVFINDNVGTASPRVGAQSTGVLTISGTIANGASGSALYISGAGGAGKVVLSGTNTYTGLTGIVRGWLVLGADNTLPTNTTLSINSANITDKNFFDLNGHNQTIGQLLSGSTNNPAVITNTAATPATLTINQNANSTYFGDVGGNLALVKGGTGTLTLANTNNLTWSGNTTLNAGTLLLGFTNANTTFFFNGNQGALGPNYLLDQSFVDWAASKVVGPLPVIAMTSNGANLVTFSGPLSNTFLGAAGPAVTNINGAIWGDTTVRLGGGSGTLFYVPGIGSGTNLLIGPVGGNGASVVALLGVNSQDYTVIQSGALQITGDATLGAVPGAFSPTNLVINGGILLGPGGDITVSANRGIAVGTNGGSFGTAGILRIPGLISDLPGQAGSVAITSGGQVVFSANNSYSGGTLIPAGAALVIQGNSAVGTGLLNLNGGTFRAASTAPATTYVSNNVIVTGNSTVGNVNAKTIIFLGTVTLSGNRTLTAGTTDSDTFAGVITDNGNNYSLTKQGAGTFTFSNVNAYGGGTIVNAGVLALATNYAPGTGAITLSNATLRTTGGSGWVLTNSLQIAANSSNVLDAASDMILSNGANIAGSGQVLKTGGNLLQLWGNNSGFSGTFINSNSTTWLNQDVAGSSNANWYLLGGALGFNDDNGGVGKTIQLGSLSGVLGTVLRAGGTQAGTTTFAIGALGTNTQFDGQIHDGVNTTIKTAINKVGPGVWTLTDANTYSGGTTISGGTIALSGSGTLGSNFISVAKGAQLDVTALGGGLTLIAGQNLTNRGTVAGGLIVSSSALASGGGNYAGAVTVLAGSTLSPGIGGDTNFFQSLSLAGGATNRFWIGGVAVHDLSQVTNSLTAADAGQPLLRLDLSSYTVSGGTIVLYDNLFSGRSSFDGTNQWFQLSDVGGPNNLLSLKNGVTFAAVGGGSTTNLFTIRYDFVNGTDGVGNDIVLTVIPEPSSLNLLALLGAGFLLRRLAPRLPRRRNG